MEVLKKKAEKLATSEFSILIHGESGTGKELIASAVHNASKRKYGPYLAVNFSALPDELIESELFGYEEGAFTGARKGGKAGLFELADQGTLFLDEIGDISPKIQSRLLRVLQEKEVFKLGGTRNIPVNARIVAATNKNLFEMVRRGEFREDLYYRLKKLTLTVPPLRDRKEDVLPLLRHFLIQKNGAGLKLTSEATRHLESYDWPGNVRELENTVEYMLAISDSSQGDLSILPEDLLRLKTPHTRLHSDRMVSPRHTADEVSQFLLETVSAYNREGRLIGRKTLSECSVERGFNLTEPQVRRLLGRLSREGKIQMGKGRSGVHLTKNSGND
jgi:transcriptional regulator with PAS, ATPase and Fis domain